MSRGTAWDCHAHVIDPDRFPLWPGRGYDPSPASLEAFLAVLDRLRISHGVLVQPSVYHFDNRCLLDALDRAEGRLLGVAVPAPDSTARDLEKMHGRGVRAVRCNTINPGGLDPDRVAGWQPVLRDLGWHVEMHTAVGDIADLRARVEAFSVPVVIDHMGRPAPGCADPDDPAMQPLIDLVRDGACFVKLSAPYRLSSAPAPWSELAPLAHAFVEANPARCLWGSDWPHVDCRTPVDTDELADVLTAWCPDPDSRRTILSDSPRALFGNVR